jgi:hypothetical protein
VALPDRTKLRVGDKIRLLTVPQGDLEQREREIHENRADPGWTANTIERIIAQCPVVSIDRIDDDSGPWFDVDIENEGGEVEEHSLAIMDDDSWEYA